jgi:undecaprenyl-diphosphatase
LPGAPSFPLRHAIALGVVQGPSELLPVSSSGHTALLPAVLGWPYATLRPNHRKAFDVALHAGGAAGIVAASLASGPAPRGLPRRGARRRSVLRRGRYRGLAFRSTMTTLTVLPAVLGGLLLRRQIEDRLGGPRSVAMAQVVSGAALGAADRLPARRDAADARPIDALLLGVGQAVALVPGVSRSGGVLVAARLLRFRRPDAAALAWRAALPVLLGATLLQAARLAREGLPRELERPFAAGAAAALASTVVSAPLARVTLSGGSLTPIAAYRVALGAGALLLLRRRGAGPRAVPAAAPSGA